MKHFDESTSGLFTHAELAKYLLDALLELDGIAEAGCSNVVPGYEPCGHCSVCSAARTLDDLDKETARRVADEFKTRNSFHCPTCGAPPTAPCLDDDFNVVFNHPARRR